MRLHCTTVTTICAYNQIGSEVGRLAGPCEVVSASHAFVLPPAVYLGGYDCSRAMVSLLVVIRAVPGALAAHLRSLPRDESLTGDLVT